MNRFVLAASLGAALFACDDEETTPGGEGGAAAQSPLEVGCQHFEFGPENPRVTTADGAGADAHIAAVHQRYAITFAELDGGNGLARFTANAAGAYYFMLSDEVPFALQASGADVPPLHTVAGGAECPAAAIVHHYMLDAGDYTLAFGDAPNDQVVLVVHLDGQVHHHGEGGEGGHGEGGHAHGGEGGHGEGGHAPGGEGGHGEGGHGEGGHAPGGEGGHGEGGHAAGGQGGA